ncbi:MAG TPA: selenocysteine-specific translation elongation factor [Burkholderiales bacterium]|nr:selenocysteine-specific translation elongation factor [Burkholderiales bacterium]
MIVGTAGHIDHGKTALLKALTGVDADRLPEEKARGITLDLGYAYTPLPGGEVLGFVDVPGHERLVHNMLAGATGIDFVLLVVAADDGPMPQTREHLQIVDLLGLSHGAVAVTKIDAVSAERAAQAQDEVRRLLRGTALEGAPLFPVSSVTGGGVDALRAHLGRAAGEPGGRDSRGHFRLAIDRCFTLKGTGTVVTGAVHSGTVRVGDELLLSPPGIPVRVRGIHAQDRAAEAGLAGQRCALNLAGPEFDRQIVQRGHWVLEPALHAPTQRIDVQLRLLDSEPRALKHWTPAHVHLGARDVPGRVALLEGETLEPGATALAQLVLDRPDAVLAGDRFVVRDQSASRTMGGGVALDPFPPQKGRRASGRLSLLRTWRSGDARAAFTAALGTAALGIDVQRFALAWNLREEERPALFDGVAMRRVRSAATDLVFSASAWQGLRQALLAAVAAEHGRAPDMVGVSRERLRRLGAPSLAPAAYEALLDELLGEGLIVASGAWLHDPAHRVRFGAQEEHLWSKVRPMLDATPFHPPRVRDLAHALHVEEEAMRRLLQRAARLGVVYPVAHDHYFTLHAVDALAEIVRDLNRAKGAALAAEFRDRIGTGRRLAIQILEFFDRVGYTRRAGDAHLLRQPALFAAREAPLPLRDRGGGEG